MLEKKKISLTTQMLIALVLGVGLGFTLQAIPQGTFRDDVIIDGLLWFMGEAFLNAIWFIVVPIVFTSLVVGVSSITEPRKLGKIGGKTIAFYLSTTILAISLALFFGMMFNPSQGVNVADIEQIEPTIGAAQPIPSILVNIIPRNPFAALTTTSTLQIIFVSIAFGLAIISVGDKAKPVNDFMEALNEVVLKIAGVVMKFAPYGAFALIARSFVQLGLDAILALIAFVLVVWFVLAFHTVFVYGAALALLAKKGPNGERVRLGMFFKKTLPSLAFGFASASSAATIPVTLKATDSLGLDRKLSSFSIPLGATVNMDGTAIYQGVAIIFLAGLHGLHLGPGEIITVLITATLASIGTAGVPGAGMIMLSVVLTSIGLPMESIAIIFGIDRIVDMPRTSINVFGDIVCSTIVATHENAFDWARFQDPSIEAPSIASSTSAGS